MKSRKFSVRKDYYDYGCELFSKEEMVINSGLTVLVGCNGAGKSTLIRHIQDELKAQEVRHMCFDNLEDGGKFARDCALHSGNMKFLANSILSSEGENIVMNVGDLAGRLGRYFQTHKGVDEFWLLIDAVDSGLSIDNVLDLKRLFGLVIKDNPSTDIYIVVSANEYELASGEQCFDVANGCYTTFENYDAFKKFIIASRKQKDGRGR